VRQTLKRNLVFAAAGVIIAGCAPQQRMGMVVDPKTGLQIGSTVSKNIIVDSSQFVNRKVKVRIRNTSGDQAFDLHGFKSSLERAYAEKGYEPSRKDDFRILIDVNVTYSGQVSRNMASQFGLIGASAGGLVGTAKGGALGAAAGVVTGATLGHIVGSYVTEDTYVVVASINLGIMKLPAKKSGRTIVFSASQKKERKKRKAVRPFEQPLSNRIAVYAGGRNTPQAAISGDVRQRFLRILSDAI